MEYEQEGSGLWKPKDIKAALAPAETPSGAGREGLMTPTQAGKLYGLLNITSVTAPITNTGGALGVSAATTAAAGSMSAADKTKVDNLYTPSNASGTQSFTDFNAITKSGFYNAYNPTNASYANVWWHVIHQEHEALNGYSWQEASDLSNGTNRYIRWRVGGVWSAWQLHHYDTGWLTPTFRSGYSSWGGWPVRVRRVNNLVVWDGMFTNGSAVATTVLDFPAAISVPGGSIMFRCPQSAGDGLITIPAGTARMDCYSGIPPVNNWWSLAGLSYLVG